MNAIRRRGVLVVLSSPSGAGKSTLSRLLLEQDDGLSLSVSVTTRKRRPSEVQGIHYDFVSNADFERMRERGELLEWAEVHGNKYGTPRDPVEQALCEGRDVLFDIDWQGADQMRAAMAEDLVSIFILPPSGAELQSRLVRRAEDDEATIRRRLDNAREELDPLPRLRLRGGERGSGDGACRGHRRAGGRAAASPPPDGPRYVRRRNFRRALTARRPAAPVRRSLPPTPVRPARSPECRPLRAAPPPRRDS